LADCFIDPTDLEWRLVGRLDPVLTDIASPAAVQP
jgi:hypothetical protein